MTILYQELNHVLICFDHGSHVEGFRCTAEVLPFRNKPHRYHSSVDSLSSSWPWMMPSVKLSVWSNSWSADQRYLNQYLLYNTIFSGLFTSINPSYFDVHQGYYWFWHTAIWSWSPSDPRPGDLHHAACRRAFPLQIRRLASGCLHIDMW